MMSVTNFSNINEHIFHLLNGSDEEILGQDETIVFTIIHSVLGNRWSESWSMTESYNVNKITKVNKNTCRMCFYYRIIISLDKYTSFYLWRTMISVNFPSFYERSSFSKALVGVSMQLFPHYIYAVRLIILILLTTTGFCAKRVSFDLC